MKMFCVKTLRNLPSRLEYASKFYAIVNMLREGRSSFDDAAATALLGKGELTRIRSREYMSGLETDIRERV